MTEKQVRDCLASARRGEKTQPPENGSRKPPRDNRQRRKIDGGWVQAERVSKACGETTGALAKPKYLKEKVLQT